MKKTAEEIAKIIKDYRKGDFPEFDSAHVLKWVAQFDKTSQKTILSETKNLLDELYITEESIKKLFNDIITLDAITDGKHKKFWQNATILDIQNGGSSQKEMNPLFLEIIKSTLKVDVPINDYSKDNIFYLDDFLFTGNRAYNDLTKLINENNISNKKIEIVFIGWYNLGEYYFSKRFTQFVNTSKKNITFRLWSYEEKRLENRLSYKNNSECFWMTHVDDDIYKNLGLSKDNVKLRNVIQKPTYRFFSQEQNRQVLEEQFLKYGVEIISSCDNPNAVMRPLGFSPFQGFGFGAIVTSYRNCPNNCPLVLWWGDITKSSGNSLDNWYPLLPRKVYKKDIKLVLDLNDEELSRILKIFKK